MVQPAVVAGSMAAKLAIFQDVHCSRKEQSHKPISMDLLGSDAVGIHFGDGSSAHRKNEFRLPTRPQSRKGAPKQVRNGVTNIPAKNPAGLVFLVLCSPWVLETAFVPEAPKAAWCLVAQS